MGNGYSRKGSTFIGAWYMKCVGDGDDIGGEDGGECVIEDCGEAEGDNAGEDGGDIDARRPLRLRSSGFVDRFSGSSGISSKTMGLFFRGQCE